MADCVITSGAFRPRVLRCLCLTSSARPGNCAVGLPIKLVAAPEFAGKELFRFNYAHAPDVKDIGEMNDDQIRKGLRAAKRILR